MGCSGLYTGDLSIQLFKEWICWFLQAFECVLPLLLVIHLSLRHRFFSK